MDLSVIICTRNRSSSLRRTLETLVLATAPPETAWELIIVDNGSTDDTTEVIESFAGLLPVQMVFEPLAGLSNARNAGVAAATGAYIIWTDDDVDVGSQWLAAYQQAFRAWPDAAVFGGPISPLLEAPSPAWFADNLDLLHLLLATRQFGPSMRQLSVEDDLIPFGANFAIRTIEQKRYLYDPVLGAGSNNARLGEETVLIKQLLLAGASGYWVPEAAVMHRIILARQSLAHVEDYFVRLGRTVAHGSLTAEDNSYLQRLIRHFIARLANRFLLAASKPWLPARMWLPRFMSHAFHKGALEQVVQFRAA